MPIRAVVFDIGGVLERVDDHSWPTTSLDDSAAAVAGAREAGWHAVLHTDTATSIAQLETLLARGARQGPDDVGASRT